MILFLVMALLNLTSFDHGKKCNIPMNLQLTCTPVLQITPALHKGVLSTFITHIFGYDPIGRNLSDH